MLINQLIEEFGEILSEPESRKLSISGLNVTDWKRVPFEWDPERTYSNLKLSKENREFTKISTGWKSNYRSLCSKNLLSVESVNEAVFECTLRNKGIKTALFLGFVPNIQYTLNVFDFREHRYYFEVVVDNVFNRFVHARFVDNFDETSLVGKTRNEAVLCAGDGNSPQIHSDGRKTTIHSKWNFSIR